MLNPVLKGKYEVTAKVIAPKWIHVSLGKIDLAKISEPMADKLVKKGYLVKKEEKASKKSSKNWLESEE